MIPDPEDVVKALTDPGRTAPVTPLEVLVALRELLEPTPILPNLPTTLQLFSHLTRVAERVRDEASLALSLHDERQLSTHDSWRVMRCARRNPCEMDDLSLALRKEHLRRMLTMRTVRLEAVQRTLDAYLPADPAATHKMNFCSSIAGDAEAVAQLLAARAEVDGWIEGVRAAHAAGSETPPIPREFSLDDACEEAMRLSESVVLDYTDLQRMFPKGVH